MTLSTLTATVRRQMLKRTPLYDFHVSLGAKMVDFVGWEMPILYRGIVDEHEQTRRSGSIFDVSHMGRLHFTGREAGAFLNRVLTRNVAEQKVGQSRYSLVCGDAGGVLDDVIVSRYRDHWLVVCNASNRHKLVGHVNDLRRRNVMGAHDLDFDFSDHTESTAMVAIQGPKVIDRLADILPVDLRSLKRYQFATEEVLLTPFSVFRSGYTGEDGVELIFPAKAAAMATRMLADRGDREGATVRPAGLGARDTLRLEAAMPLYGHELGEQIDPLSAGLGWAVDLNKDFIGAEPLRAIAAAGGPKRKLVGLELEGRRIARQGAPVLRDGQLIGEVTSGTFGPTVHKSIAMALVDATAAAEGTELSIDLKGTQNAARVVKLPFYKRSP